MPMYRDSGVLASCPQHPVSEHSQNRPSGPCEARPLAVSLSAPKPTRPVGRGRSEPGEEATRLWGSSPILLCLDFTSVKWERGARAGLLVDQKTRHQWCGLA